MSNHHNHDEGVTTQSWSATKTKQNHSDHSTTTRSNKKLWNQETITNLQIEATPPTILVATKIGRKNLSPLLLKLRRDATAVDGR
jgi:hypothetical protein